MTRRILVLVAACALATTSIAYADDENGRDCTPDVELKLQQDVPQAEVEVLTPATITLEELFATPESKEVATDDGVGADVGPIEVVLLRRDADGKPVLACVDNLKAAQRFLNAPVEKLPAKQAKEQ
jgi:hypothetical protein